MKPEENLAMSVGFTFVAVLVIFCGGFAVTLSHSRGRVDRFGHGDKMRL